MKNPRNRFWPTLSTTNFFQYTNAPWINQTWTSLLVSLLFNPGPCVLCCNDKETNNVHVEVLSRIILTTLVGIPGEVNRWQWKSTNQPITFPEILLKILMHYTHTNRILLLLQHNVWRVFRCYFGDCLECTAQTKCTEVSTVKDVHLPNHPVEIIQTSCNSVEMVYRVFLQDWVSRYFSYLMPSEKKVVEYKTHTTNKDENHRAFGTQRKQELCTVIRVF